MKHRCKREGHGYVRTASGGVSRRCVWCGGIRWPWSREQALPEPQEVLA